MRGLLVVYFVVNAFLGIGQISLTGTVQDSSSYEELPNVIIQIQDKKDGAIMDFTITNQWGHFEISTSLDSGIISANLFGYETKFFFFNKKEEFNFDLSFKENALEEITVRAYKSGFIRNGDTITYKPEVFTNGTEENLKDVLERLPGIDVDENGKITANGKPVDKFKIEGDEFMNNNRNTALLGIGADNIKDVDLYLTKELTTGNDQSILDIKLKSEFKQRWNGELHIGGGIRNKYMTKGIVYRFGHRTKLFFDAKANNIESRPINVSDYHQLNGGMLSYLKSVVNQRSRIPSFFLNNANNRKQRFFLPSFNFSHKITSSSKISGFLLGYTGISHQENTTESIENQVLKLVSSNIVNIKTSNVFSRIQYENEIDNKSSLEVIASANINFGKNRTVNQSSLQQNEIEQTVEKLTDNKQGFGNINYKRIIGEKLFFHANAGYLAYSDDLYSELESNQTIPWAFSLIGTDVKNAVLKNYTTNQTVYAETGIRSNWREDIEFNSSFGVSKNILKGWTELDSPNMLNRLSDEFTFNNNLKFQKGLWQIKVGGTIQYAKIKSLTSEVSKSYTFLPDLSIQYKFRTGFRNINLSYRANRTLATIYTALSIPYFENSTIINRNEINLDDFEKRQGITLFYGDINLLDNQTIWLFLNYSKGHSINGSNTLFFEDYQIIEQVLRKTTTFLGGAKYEKKISRWKSSISAKVNYFFTQSPLFLQNLELNQDITNTSLNFSYNSIFKKGFNFELAYKITHSNFKFANTPQKNFITDTYAKIFLKKESYKIQLEYNYFNSTVNNEAISSHYINASATKSIRKNWSIFIKANHILQLNNDVQQSISTNEFNIYEKNIYFNFPGYLISGIKWSF